MRLEGPCEVRRERNESARQVLKEYFEFAIMETVFGGDQVTIDDVSEAVALAVCVLEEFHDPH